LLKILEHIKNKPQARQKNKILKFQFNNKYSIKILFKIL